ncbi:kinase-like domain-containing protein [Rhizophagus clarus]|uniref:Kinase-like domain-containing protein n=1 Tax=Rhizophagus clarus TaxID=94130 RepID=A0A8H3R4J6_9GLOM|nr:kinase-like domain-containing protein [Rhizophagus clarus]
MDSFLESIKKLIKPRDCECDYECNAYRSKQNFKKWTSGNNYIDKFIQDTQLSDHDYCRSEINKMCNAKWIDGCIIGWDDYNQNWERDNQCMAVSLKSLNNPAKITLEYINKIAAPYKIYGITQDSKTKNYMVVYDVNKCRKCIYRCNAVYFQRNFNNWTSGNNDIDRFIQDTQISAHDDAKVALEWIPYDRFRYIEYHTGSEINKVYNAEWIDGYILWWNNYNQNWVRDDQYMAVTLKSLNNPANITLEYINKIAEPCEIYGITQDLETKNYMVVFDTNKCRKCKRKCDALYFQCNFNNWTSENAIEWIPYDKLYNIKYIKENDFGKVYNAIWIDDRWNNGKRYKQNMFVTLKYLNNPASITLEFINKIAGYYRVHGISRDSKTKNYMVVLDINVNYCEKCRINCNAVYFQHNFDNWTSGNRIIDEFIQKTQLLAHTTHSISGVLEWIPYNKFYNVKYIAKGGFGKVYRANWIEGYIDKWDDNHLNWNRKDQNMTVALKSLNNSKNITLEFMNEITLHYKVNFHRSVVKLYGITQDPGTKNYIMVLDYARDGNLRNYLDTSYDKLSWTNKLNYLHSIAHGLKNIHEEGLIHRDLHIVPQLIVHLIKRCLDADPLNRPEAGDIKKTLSQLFRESHDPDKYDVFDDSGIRKQIEEAERTNNKLQTGSTLLTSLGISYETHSGAIYTSRLLNFDNLPQPKNSYDYYEVNDNIISMKFSESLQIDIFKLNNNDVFDLKNSNSCYGKNDNIDAKSLETLQVGISQFKINDNLSELENPDDTDDHHEENDDIINTGYSESLQIDIN